MKPRRAFAAVFAVLHLLGAAAWPLVDARLEAAEQRAVAHVESERAAPCTPYHDDVFCQGRRTLAGHASAGAISTILTGPILAVVEAPRPEISPAQVFLSAQTARAPPLS